MKFNISDYKTLLFDCDGVVLDSNRVKTEAFYHSTLPYGKSAAEAMIDYHISNGGVSRYKKFAYFIENIVLINDDSLQKKALDVLLETYASYVKEGLLNCNIAQDLESLRMKTHGAKWLIVSGGDQAELREVFTRRDIAQWFDGGIFGSPDTKDEILQREICCGNVLQPALFLGDSKYDYYAARLAKLDFLFISGWSEVADWKDWSNQNDLSFYTSLRDLI